MKKQQTYSKAQAKRLIREIAKVTQSNGELGKNFAALLSAMRGPDYVEDSDAKMYTTGVIRRRLGWRCGAMGGGNTTLDEVRTMTNRAVSSHFRAHIRVAVEALEYFGYGDKQTKGGEKS